MWMNELRKGNTMGAHPSRGHGTWLRHGAGEGTPWSSASLQEYSEVPCSCLLQDPVLFHLFTTVILQEKTASCHSVQS